VSNGENALHGACLRGADTIVQFLDRSRRRDGQDDCPSAAGAAGEYCRVA